MKTNIKFTLSLVFLFIFVVSYSQSALNYQGVVRDASNNPYSDEGVTVRFTVLDASLASLYTETDILTTNALGYINTLVGDADASAFALLDWSSGDFSLKVELDRGSDGTYEIDETIALASVPYALYGKDEDADPANELQSLDISGRTITLSDGNSIDVPDQLQTLSLNTNQLSISGSGSSVSLAGYVSPWLETGSGLYYNSGNIGIGTTIPSGKFHVQGEATWSDTEPLFQVKNSDGVPVFAVYNNGVQILVEDDPDSKGRPRGGFSVAGFDRSNKSFDQTYDFMRISPDSIRFNIDNSAAKGPRGGFAVGGFDRANKGVIGEDFMHLTPQSAIQGYYNTFIGYKAGEDNSSSGNYNSFIGYQAGTNNTTGDYNTFMGYRAGDGNTTGSTNIFIGYNAGNTGNNNVYIGNSAGARNTSGYSNVFLGHNTGSYNTTGRSNVFIGHETGYDNTTGNYNSFIGYQSGANNTSGNYNTFMGYRAGDGNTTGSSNVLIGYNVGNAGSDNIYIGNSTGANNTSGQYNVFLGHQTGILNTTGTSNVIIGHQAGYTNSSGSDNVFIGHQSGVNNSTGRDNLFMGFKSGLHNTTAHQNTFLGSGAGSATRDGGSNTFVGFEAGRSNLGGYNNVFLGYRAGLENTTAIQNVCLGSGAGYANRTGVGNTIVGFEAGRSNLAGSYNVLIGRYAGLNEMGSQKLYIDNSSTTTPLIWGDFLDNIVRFNSYVMNNSPQAAYDIWIQGGTGGFQGGDNRNLALLGLSEAHGDRLIINYGSEYANGTRVEGNLYYTGSLSHSSDRSLKTNIVPLSSVLEKLKQLNGVYFDFKDTKIYGDQRNIGMIAQDMQLQFPELVSDMGGGILGINYADFGSVLLEGIKEQQTIIEKQDRRIESLEAELSEIKQMVSALMEERE